MFNKDIEVAEDGAVYVKGEETEPYEPDPTQIVTTGYDRNRQNRQLLAQIQLVTFDDRLALQKQGDNLFYQVADADGNVAAPQISNAQIIQGALEKSNVQIVREMVELIHNHRMYEANAKAVTTQDTMLDASVNQVGTVG